MNKSEIKRIVFEQLWDEEQPDVDIKINISKQIDTFLSYLTKEDSPLSLLPIEAMTDYEIALFAFNHVKRLKNKSGNRSIYSNIETL